MEVYYTSPIILNITFDRHIARNKDFFKHFSSQVSGSFAAKIAAGEVPQQFANVMTMFIEEYAESNLLANEPPERFKENVFTFLKSVQQALKDPYKFDPFHQAIREPFDYYKWCVATSRASLNYLILSQFNYVDNITYM